MLNYNKMYLKKEFRIENFLRNDYKIYLIGINTNSGK
ncbi:hypothetical protein JOC61_001104 [Marinitoga litoralis]|nr:hypothetical protein [Marinitoga litoralis]